MAGHAVKELRDEVAKLTNEMQIFTATRHARDEATDASVATWVGPGRQSLSLVPVPVPATYSMTPAAPAPLPPLVPSHQYPTPDIHLGYTTIPNTTVLESRSVEVMPFVSRGMQQFSTTIPKYHLPGQPLTVIGPDGVPFNVIPPALPPGSQFLVQPPPRPPSTPVYPQEDPHPIQYPSSIPVSNGSTHHQHHHMHHHHSEGGQGYPGSNRPMIVYKEREEEPQQVSQQAPPLQVVRQAEPVLISGSEEREGRYSIPAKMEKCYFSIQASGQRDPVVTNIYEDEKLKMLLGYLGETDGVFCDETNQVIDLEATPKELGLPAGRLLELRYFGGSGGSRRPPTLGSPKSSARRSVGSPKTFKQPPLRVPRAKTPAVVPLPRSRSRSSSAGRRRRRAASPKGARPPPPRAKTKSVSFG